MAARGFEPRTHRGAELPYRIGADKAEVTLERLRREPLAGFGGVNYQAGMQREIENADFVSRNVKPVEWIVADQPVDYDAAVIAMERRVEAIVSGEAGECVWLVEHPPLYTAGTSARPADLIDPGARPVYPTGRGGQYTYHGPGQRVAYVMLDLKRRRPDVHAFVLALETWIIGALAQFNIRGERRENRVGVWVRRPDKAPGLDGAAAEDKIAAIGVRLRRWVSFHGIAVNVEPDLSHFAGIVPCGIGAAHLGVTSLIDLGIVVSLPEFDRMLRAEFEVVFGSTRTTGTGTP